MRLQNPRLSELFKTPQRKTYTLTAITAFMVGVFLLFAIRPTFLKIAELNSEIKQKEELLAKIEKKLEILNYLIREKQSVDTELEAFDKSFPVEEKTGFIVANLARVAEKYNIDLMSVEFEKPTQEILLDVENVESVNVLVVRVSIEGSLNDVQGYISYFEFFPRIFDIQTISYSKQDITKYSEQLDQYREIVCAIDLYIYNWIDYAAQSDAETVVQDTTTLQ